MSVADSGDVLTGSAVLHGQSSFINHLSCSLQGKKNTQRKKLSFFLIFSHLKRTKDIIYYNVNINTICSHTGPTQSSIINSHLILLPENVKEFVNRRIYTRSAFCCEALTDPRMCAPSILSVSLWLRIFTIPSVSALVLARLLAAKGNLPTLYGMF